MQKKGSGVVYSPSDLSTFLRSPFASWMDRYALEVPGEVERDPRTEDGELLLRKGRQHEASVLETFRAQGRDIVEIERGPEAVARTREALQDGREVISQAALVGGPFAGFADFLVRSDLADPGSDNRLARPATTHRPLEAKLARRTRPEDVVQLCCYADLLSRSTPRIAAQEAVKADRNDRGDLIAQAVPTIGLALGGGDTVALRTADFIYYYDALRRAFLDFMERWDPATPPIPQAGGKHRPWQRLAESTLEELDHPSRVAGITSLQTRRLEAAGIRTLKELAQAPIQRVPGMNEATLQRLRTQARLQFSAAGLTGDGTPPFEIVPPDPADPRRGLALLPPPSSLDVYFDIEGFPLGREPLEYLFGVTFVENDDLRFRDWWAHDGDAEKRAFEGFVDWTCDRFRRDPAMHVYHYGAYETNVLKRLMGRFGTREREIDALLGAEVFCDLYQVVRTGLVVGAPSYSIKHIERLFRQRREGDVGTAVDSIVFYQRFLDSGQPPDWRTSPILQQIRAYNRDDCDSTLQLTSWLRHQATARGVDWAGRAKETRIQDPDRPLPPAELEHRALLERLSAAASPACALLGQLLEFHRREDRPMWWAMFDRHEMTDEDLIADVNCLGGLRLLGAAKPAPGVRNKRFRYGFATEQDTKIAPGRACFFAHDLNVTARIDTLDHDRGEVTIELTDRALERAGGPPTRLGLIPSEWVPTDPLKRSIEKTARRYLEGDGVQSALDDFLQRRPPRFLEPAAGLPVRDGESPVEAVLRLVPAMDRTTLFIQGPPGSGKTTTAARAIVDLIGRGKTVGIASNSHTAVVNLMRKCASVAGGRLPCVKVGGSRDRELLDSCEGAEHCTSSRDAAGLLRRLPLMGGTAWLFSRPEMAEKLDHLFIDEAGQVSVANLVGMAPAAHNLVLVGDQMQLPQPIQGAHPGDSGRSTLDYFLGAAKTIPADRGVFLGTTYRLHPDLCGFISSAFYDGRLRADPRCAQRVVRLAPDSGRPHYPGYVDRESGVVFVPVTHEGNTQASPEEVEVVRQLVRWLCGRERTDLNGRVVGKLTPRDVLVVAPYNLQVRRLQQALPAEVRAGTVDKFQGQEAPVVIVTLCASEGHGSPRGLEFLLNPNRLNVALSRAQSLALVVGHPGLALTSCSTVDPLKRVNLLCRIIAAGSAELPEKPTIRTAGAKIVGPDRVRSTQRRYNKGTPLTNPPGAGEA